MSGPQFIRPQSTGLSGLGEMLQAATEAKKVPKFTDALELIWSALPEKAIDNAVKDNCNWLQACVSDNSGNFEHVMWQFV